METTVGTENRGFLRPWEVKPAERMPIAHLKEMTFPPNIRAFSGLFACTTVRQLLLLGKISD